MQRCSIQEMAKHLHPQIVLIKVTHSAVLFEPFMAPKGDV